MRVYYYEYIQSEKWRCVVRPAVLKRDGHRCVRCDEADGLQVHHVTYSMLGREEADGFRTVISVCGPCHEFLHGRRRFDPARLRTWEGLADAYDRL